MSVCTHHADETQHSWNIEGPQGPKGDTGAARSAVISGYSIVAERLSFDSIAHKVFGVNCPTGKVAVGGGDSVYPSLSDPNRGQAPIVVRRSKPDINGGGRAAITDEIGDYPFAWDIDLYATCVMAAP